MDGSDRYQAVIFDLDGTLLDTLDDLADSANEMLGRRGYPAHPVEAYKHFIGNGMLKLVERVLPSDVAGDPAHSRAALAEYESIYAGRCNLKTRPYPGVRELVDRLGAAGVKIGVLSNKKHDLSVQCIGAAFPGVSWFAVLGQREGVPRKPDPAAAFEAAAAAGVEPGRCAFIGDSGVDMLTAASAGMYPVGVTWGFRDRDELRSGGAAALIDRPGELFPLLGLGAGD